MDAEKDRNFLLKKYGFNFPLKTKYVRHPNRIYFATDFSDGEDISFAWACDKPSSNAMGYAYYYSKSKGHKLISINDILQ